MVQLLGTPDKTATVGEKKIFKLLQMIFSTNDSVYLYTEPYFKGLRPDYVLIGDSIGAIIVEIKDYLESSLISTPKAEPWKLLKNRSDEQKIIPNPYDQLYKYWKVAQNAINGCEFPNNIQIPIHRILIFTNISKSSEIGIIISKTHQKQVQIGFKEDIHNSKTFTTFFLNFSSFSSHFNFSTKHIKLLRANLFPIARLPSLHQKKLFEFLSVKEKIHLLDLKQEKFARELGSGHRLLFGVAGSGKTVVLIARARVLALRHTDWRILVICYNRLLQKVLYQTIIPQDFQAQIFVESFHKWAQSIILSEDSPENTAYQEILRKIETQDQKSVFFGEIVPKLLKQTLIRQKTNNQKITRTKFQYDAILIDEAQDFEKEWLESIMLTLNPESNSLFIACDGLQGIYARKKFYWSDVGIQARGRVKKLTKSYRNPQEVGICAKKVLPSSFIDLIKTDEACLETEVYGFIKGIVEIYPCNTRKEEYTLISDIISQIQNFNHFSKSTVILNLQNLSKHQYNHPIIDIFNEKNIHWIPTKRWNGSREQVLLITPYTAKGLEFDIVIIPEVDKYDTREKRQLLYVGITRSTQRVIFTGKKGSPIVTFLEDIIKNIYSI
ncbi:ATP-binding domain-containing protein [Candidatus Harpocratesius sp.]